MYIKVGLVKEIFACAYGAHTLSLYVLFPEGSNALWIIHPISLLTFISFIVRYHCTVTTFFVVDAIEQYKGVDALGGKIDNCFVNGTVLPKQALCTGGIFTT